VSAPSRKKKSPARKSRKAAAPRRRPRKVGAIPPAQASAVPQAAGPPPRKYYRCPAGHEQNDTEEFSLRLGNRFTGEVLHDTGPLCYRCVFDFVNGEADRVYDEGGDNWYAAVFEFLVEHFQTHRIAPPEPAEITDSEMAAVVQAAERAQAPGPIPDFVDRDGAAQYKCAGVGCMTFISCSGTPDERPRFCPAHETADADRPLRS
jgi:hypothetical protein